MGHPLAYLDVPDSAPTVTIEDLHMDKTWQGVAYDGEIHDPSGVLDSRDLGRRYRIYINGEDVTEQFEFGRGLYPEDPGPCCHANARSDEHDIDCPHRPNAIQERLDRYTQEEHAENLAAAHLRIAARREASRDRLLDSIDQKIADIRDETAAMWWAEFPTDPDHGKRP